VFNSRSNLIWTLIYLFIPKLL